MTCTLLQVTYTGHFPIKFRLEKYIHTYTILFLIHLQKGDNLTFLIRISVLRISYFNIHEFLLQIPYKHHMTY